MNALTIAAPVTGKLLGWVLSPSREVTADELLGEVRADDGTLHALRAPADGSFRAGTRGGAAVEVGAPLAVLHPTAPPADAPRAALRATTPTPALLPSPPAPRPVEARVEREVPPVAAIAPPIVEELTLPPRAPRQKKPTAAPAPVQEKLERKTYYLTPSQMARIRALSDELEGGEARAGESEILRAAVELLLALPQPALLATLKENRERERAGKYGRGYPRPGNPNIGEISKQRTR